jgi:hypothetical protein
MLGGSRRGTDHDIVRFEVLWYVRVLEITSEAQSFLSIAIVIND